MHAHPYLAAVTEAAGNLRAAEKTYHAAIVEAVKEGEPVTHVAQAAQRTRATIYNRVNRYTPTTQTSDGQRDE